MLGKTCTNWYLPASKPPSQMKSSSNINYILLTNVNINECFPFSSKIFHGKFSLKNVTFQRAKDNIVTIMICSQRLNDEHFFLKWRGNRGTRKGWEMWITCWRKFMWKEKEKKTPGFTSESIYVQVNLSWTWRTAMRALCDVWRDGKDVGCNM